MGKGNPLPTAILDWVPGRHPSPEPALPLFASGTLLGLITTLTGFYSYP